jgi:hypothetical protein
MEWVSPSAAASPVHRTARLPQLNLVNQTAWPLHDMRWLCHRLQMHTADPKFKFTTEGNANTTGSREVAGRAVAGASCGRPRVAERQMTPHTPFSSIAALAILSMTEALSTSGLMFSGSAPLLSALGSAVGGRRTNDWSAEVSWCQKNPKAGEEERPVWQWQCSDAVVVGA